MAKLTDLSALGGFLTEEERQTIANEHAEKAKNRSVGEGQSVLVTLDKSGRRGKIVTVIEGFVRSPLSLDDLAARLRKECGTGGTVRENTIELQGDHIKRLIPSLEKLGFEVRTK